MCVFADGTARVPVIRRVKVAKPSGPPVWHSHAGSGVVGRSSTLPSLLAQFQVVEPRRRVTGAQFDPARFTDPLDDAVDLLADVGAAGDDAANRVSAAQVAYFLLRKLDDQLTADAKRPVPKSALPALFAVLRRVIGTCAGFYETGDTGDVHATSLHLYALIVALRLLKALVLALPPSMDPEKLGFHAGVRPAGEGSTGAQAVAGAKFVDQLNWILSCPATHAVAQLSVPMIHEVIAETLSQGAVASSFVVYVFVCARVGRSVSIPLTPLL